MRQALDVGIRGATAHEYNRTLHAARLAPGGEAAHRGGLPGSRMAGYGAHDFAVRGPRGPRGSGQDRRACRHLHGRGEGEGRLELVQCQPEPAVDLAILIRAVAHHQEVRNLLLEDESTLPGPCPVPGIRVLAVEEGLDRAEPIRRLWRHDQIVVRPPRLCRRPVFLLDHLLFTLPGSVANRVVPTAPHIMVPHRATEGYRSIG